MPQIGLNDIDLPDTAKRLQMAGQFRTAHGDPDPVFALGKRADHMASHEAGSAENRNEGVDGGSHGSVP